MVSITQVRSLQPQEVSKSFRSFQDLPVLVREALAWDRKRQESHYRPGGHGSHCDITTYIVDHYDMNQMLAVGSLVRIADQWIQHPINLRMLDCYIENHCNMTLAKLAWREDY